MLVLLLKILNQFILLFLDGLLPQLLLSFPFKNYVLNLIFLESEVKPTCDKEVVVGWYKVILAV